MKASQAGNISHDHPAKREGLSPNIVLITYLRLIMLKQILIPMAALAITVTGASAFTGGDMLSKLDVNLSESETTALTEAREIHQAARAKADQVLEAAGISDERMKEIHGAMRDARHTGHEAVKAAIKANDYGAFQTATADTPMADTIDSAEEFAKLVEADSLRTAGDHEAARAIMEQLGMKGKGMGGMGGGRGGDRPMLGN